MRRKRGLTPETGTGSNIMGNKARSNIEVDTRQAGKLLMICKALDKTIHGLDGKVNLLSMVRYGVYGPTLESINEQLSCH